MEYIDGQAVLEKYSISVGELVKAILDGLPAYDAVTGKRVVDQDSMVACPRYATEEQAGKTVDLIDAGVAVSRMRRGEKPFHTYAPGGASGIDAIVRRNKIRLFMETAKVYEFPAGQERPQEPCGVFPLRYDTFSREYSEPVMLGIHGEGESVLRLYQMLIEAMRFPVASVEAHFGQAFAAETSGQEPEQAASMGGVEGEAAPEAKPTPENMLRMHQENPDRWTRKALGDRYFRNSPGENDETVKSRLQRYLAKASERSKA